jgi:hypothetical protein
MRVTDNRYTRDQSRLQLAVRLIGLEARTHTIRHWTGLSDDRIRKLYRSYLRDSGIAVHRHRGKSPRQPTYFMRSTRITRHASALASVLTVFGVVPTARQRGPSQSLAGVGNGNLLCEAYEAYRSMLPDSVISFEHAVFLASALAQGRELLLQSCGRCHSPVLTDRPRRRSPNCERCRQPQADAIAPTAAKMQASPGNPPWPDTTIPSIPSPDPTSTVAPTPASPRSGSPMPLPTAPRGLS